MEVAKDKQNFIMLITIKSPGLNVSFAIVSTIFT